MVNSLIAATGTAVLNVVLGTLAGYGLARFTFRGRGTPARPLSRLAHAAGHRADRAALSDDQDLSACSTISSALIITYVTFTLPFTIWLLQNYFADHPALAGGGGIRRRLHLGQMLGKVLLPAAMPGLVAAAHVRVHDGVERLPVRRHPDEHDRLQDACPSWSRASRPT